MKETTLCYIENNGKILMMFRDGKKDDINQGKWIGVGGKLEPGETPDECVRREVLEETGLEGLQFVYHGKICFRADTWEDEDMYLYSATFIAENQAGSIHEDIQIDEHFCDEGTLKWIDRNQIMNLPLWEGDAIFLEELLKGRTGLEMTLSYEGEKLVGVEKTLL